MTARTSHRSRAHLVDRLRLVEQRVRRAVETRRGTDPQPDDPFRGLYLCDEAVERLLTAAPLPVDSCDAAERVTIRPAPVVGSDGGSAGSALY